MPLSLSRVSRRTSTGRQALSGLTPSCGLGTPKGWKKIAIVSDAEWLEHSVKVFGWLIPGEIKVFDTDEVHDARKWLVALDEDDD